MRNAATVVVPIAAALLLVGCASPQLTTEADPTADFGAYTTFGWRQDPSTLRQVGDIPADFPQILADALTDELASRGLTFDGAQGQLLATGYVAIEGQTDTWSDLGFGVSRGSPATDIAIEWESGTLVIDLTDASTGTRVWRGAVFGEIRDDITPERVRDVVERMFADFPVDRR